MEAIVIATAGVMVAVFVAAAIGAYYEVRRARRRFTGRE